MARIGRDVFQSLPDVIGLATEQDAETFSVKQYRACHRQLPMARAAALEDLCHDHSTDAGRQTRDHQHTTRRRRLRAGAGGVIAGLQAGEGGGWDMWVATGHWRRSVQIPRVPANLI